MKSFYKRYYDDPQCEAVCESELYKEKRARRYELEEELEKALGEVGEKLKQLFNIYLDSCAAEQEVLIEQMYLLGAADRERMLK